MRKMFLTVLVCLVLSATPCWPAAQPLKIVTTQAIFADLVREVAGDKAKVSAVASPKYNLHFIQPRPSDVRDVAHADLYVNAGLDLEAWSDPLLDAAGNAALFRGRQGNLDLSRGIRLLNVPTGKLTRADGDVHAFGNPHFHMNPENAVIMVETIARKLKEIDPPNAAHYEKNAQSLLQRIDRKIVQWNNLCAHCRGKKIIAYHDDIAYFADFLGLTAEQFLEPKPGIPPTPRHLTFLENYARDNGVEAIVLPTYYPRAEAEKLAKRVGVKVVTICQGAGELPGTESFFDFFDYNVRQISEALQ